MLIGYIETSWLTNEPNSGPELQTYIGLRKPTQRKAAAVPKENCHLAKIVAGVETSVKYIPIARSHQLIPKLRSICK